MISNHKIRRVDNILTHRGVFAGPWTRSKIWEHANGIDLTKLTAVQIADLLERATKAYHAGKVSAGAEVIDDCVWVANKLIPIKALEAMEIKRGDPRQLDSGIVLQTRHYDVHYVEHY
jgi:hypothetical protein